MDETLLDTDILSEILKGKDPIVVDAGDRYLAQHGRFAFSAITFYEIYRGLRVKRAVRALKKFTLLADVSDIIPVSLPVLQRAAGLWADAYQGGHPRHDADLIIAATALENGRVLVTGNTLHFAWIPGLAVLDRRQP